MIYNFPEIKTTRTLEERIQKIKDEIQEWEDGENKDEEAVDILHTVETFIRGHFQGREDILNRTIESTIKKNYARNYYTLSCY